MLRVSKAAGFAALVLLCAGVGTRAQAPAPRPDALAALEPGLWEFKELGRGAGAPERRCVTSLLRELLQPAQPRLACKHFISENGAAHATVAYDCAARGQGRTALRVETPRLVSVDSQGVADGRPFSVRMEARRIGACSAAMR